MDKAVLRGLGARKLSSEEQELFEALDVLQPRRWPELRKMLETCWGDYAAALQEGCAANGIPFAGLSEGSYDVFAGEDENGDHVLGSPGRRWGAFGSVTAPTVITVAKGGAYAAPFTIGLPLEREPNDAIGDADLLYVGGSLYGTLPPGDFDVTRIPFTVVEFAGTMLRRRSSIGSMPIA